MIQKREVIKAVSKHPKEASSELDEASYLSNPAYF